LTPEPFTWPWISTELCASDYGSGNFSILALPDSSSSTGGGELTFGSSTATATFPATRLLGFTIYAYSVQVRFQSTDFATTKTTSPTHPTTSPTHTTTVLPQPCCIPKRLSPGAKAGIAISIVFLLGILLGTFFFIRRQQRRRSSALPTNEGSTREENNNIQGLYLKPELEAKSVDRGPKQIITAIGDKSAELQVQDTGTGIAEMGSGSGSPNHKSHSDPAEASAETALVKPRSTTKRKPIQQTYSPMVPLTIPELQPIPRTPTPEPDISTSSAPIIQEDPSSLLKTPSAHHSEQVNSPGIPSTVGSSSLQHTENPTVDEEEEWLRAELARVQERKERVREMQRLKEEEERLAKEEDALRKRMRAKTDMSRETIKHSPT
jgi:hypothetical protein